MDKSICVFCGGKRQPFKFGGKQLYQPCSCEQYLEQQRLALEEENKRMIKEMFTKNTQEVNKTKRKKLILDSNRPVKHMTRTFKNFNIDYNNKNAYEVCYEFAINNQKHNIFLTGDYGKGKTHLAVSILNLLLTNNKQVVFKSSGELFDDIISSFKDSNTSEIIRLYGSVQNLIIDDLGKERPTEFTVATLYKIINARYERELPTIITSNYTIKELVEKFTINKDNVTATAIFRRIVENCKIIEIGKTMKEKQKINNFSYDVFN